MNVESRREKLDRQRRQEENRTGAYKDCGLDKKDPLVEELRVASLFKNQSDACNREFNAIQQKARERARLVAAGLI